MDEHQPSRKRRRRAVFGRRAFELSRDVQCVIDFEGTLRDINPALERILGFPREEILGRPAVDLVHREDRARTLEESERLAGGGRDTADFEARFRTRGGDWVWLEWAGHAAQVEGLIYASGRNIDARKQREAELERAALLDPLTGLANRRGFELALEREVAAAKRHSLRPALVVLDLDRLKEINDRYGHQTGDDLLVAAAGTLVETVRASDLAARIGGDEFAVLLPDCDLATAATVAAKIVAALRRRELPIRDGAMQLSASAGVALLGQAGISSGPDLITAADRAMYRAKRRPGSFVIDDAPLA